MHCPIVVLILQCIVPQYCDLHTRDRYTAEAGLEDAGTAWCWAVVCPNLRGVELLLAAVYSSVWP